MKIGEMEFFRDEDGEWDWNDLDFNYDPFLELLNYIESHELDKADEKIAELSYMCDEKNTVINALSTQYDDMYQSYTRITASFRKTLQDKESLIEKLINERDDKDADIKTLKHQLAHKEPIKEPSYKQQFIDQAAISLFARPEVRYASDAWEAAVNLWNARKVIE